jgi:hypothetical protein
VSQQCTVVVYVDDLLITCTDQANIDEVLDHVTNKFGELTVHDGLIHSYLGMSFDFSTQSEVKITMDGYTRDLIKFANIQGTAATPATEHLFTTRESEQLGNEKKELFHSTMAKILYLAKRVRPDLLTAIAFLATRVQNPDIDDWNKLERLVKYINGTAKLGIVLTAASPTAITAFVDASYGVHDDAKSQTGLSISLGEGPFFAKCSKQKVVSKSSTEAELIGLSDSVSQVIWSREFLKAQGYDVPPAKVFQDNKSTIILANKGRSTSDRTRHINIRYFWVKDRIDTGDVVLEHLPTDDMVSDILTKPLQGSKFQELRAKLLNWRC